MDKSQIRDYVSKYKDTYSKESIKSQLINSGANADEVESLYSEMSGGGSVFPSEMRSDSEPVKKKSHVGLILGIIFFVLVLIGVLFIFIGFPMWQEAYSSGLMDQVDRQSATSSGITVEMVQAPGVLYIKNPGSEISVDISIEECDVEKTFQITSGIKSSGYDLSECSLLSGSKVSVTLRTGDAIYKETKIVS